MPHCTDSDLSLAAKCFASVLLDFDRLLPYFCSLCRSTFCKSLAHLSLIQDNIKCSTPHGKRSESASTTTILFLSQQLGESSTCLLRSSARGLKISNLMLFLVYWQSNPEVLVVAQGDKLQTKLSTYEATIKAIILKH